MRLSTTSATGTRTRVRPHALLPDRHSWVDMGFTLALAAVALTAFGSSFTGSAYLVVGLLGTVIAILVTHLTRAAGWPVISAVVICLVLFFLLGGPLCLRSLGDTYTLPGAGTLARVADQAVFGWKDLLTTLPPVDGDGPLLVLPWLAGMVAGLVGSALAHLPVRRAWLAALLPVAGMTVVLSGAILLGVRHPQSLVVQGAVFTALALAWLAIRARRASAAVHGGSTSYVRGVGAVVMLGLAALLAHPASALFVGDDSERAVARNWVEPPFDIGRYPSPLAGFRKYVDLKGEANPANVYDKTLLDIDGVPAGTRVRFAAMDRYDGMVWGATDDALPGPADDSFQRVSSTIDNPVEGKEVDATVTLGEGWSGVWLPTVGALRSMDFQTGDARAKAEVFRYNLATSTAVVPTGMQRGDSYSFTAVQPDDELSEETVGSADLTPLPAGAAFIQGPTEKWTEDAGTDPMDRVLAAAEHLRSEGKYSDGVGRTERIYVAGHSAWRLSDEFVNAPQIVGNDEQYAATMALIANDIGVPARVVLGAVVPEGGRVTGKDVSAWVELRAADGSWKTLPTEAFMSDTPPADQVPETNTPMSGTVIPPPNPIPPPSDAGEQSDADLKERKATRKKKSRRGRGQHHPGPPVLGRDGGDVRRSPAARRRPAAGRRGRPQGVAPAPAPQRGLGLGPLRGRLARARRPRARPGPARAAGTDGHPARAVGRHRVRRGRHAGPPRRQLRLRPEHARGGRGRDLLGVGRRRAAGDVAGGRPLAALPGRDQPPLAAAYDVPARARRRSAADHRRAPSRPPRPGVSRPGRDGCAGSLIGVLDVRLTKLVRRPNVGCVSWRLAAARDLV